MDADYDPSRDYKAEKKRAKKYGKAFAKKLPVFDPSSKTFDEYIDEYLKDKINDLPFTYRKVVPNDYGLTTEEILSLPDRELNAWVSVKKMSQFRTPGEEAEERRRYQARAKDLEKKKKILPSLFEKQEENPEAKSKKKKKKRKRKRAETESDADHEEGEIGDGSDTGKKVDSPPAKKLKSSPSLVNTNDSLKLNSSGKKNKGKVGVDEKQAASKETSEIFNCVEKKKGKKKQKKEREQEKHKNTDDKGTKPTRDLKTQNKKGKQKVNSGELEDTENKTHESQNGLDASSAKVKTKKRKMKTADEQKKKKKKLSINMNKQLKNDTSQKGTDNKNLERQLSKIMSASRLSKYGLGPNAAKEAKKKKKKNTVS
ncbi:protein KRI1 homolog [Elysia marginata]|uniref:Protein KRI1 homolog n=1 Tax=Elysia marginata TaxID=1093978 RepID=A0AAV4EUJ5_9GAST|nr:protein KRI1 homolog [Elysia marginata]